MSRPKFFLLLATLIFFSFAASTVNAETVIVGNNNDVTRYPFGLDPGAASAQFPDFGAGGTYQEVYASGAFSGPITITQIAFASSSQVTSGPGTTTVNCNVSLSTTAVGPNGLSTNLPANRGADFAQVFSGQITATLTANDQFDLVINITPFTYDPAHGNLLLEVVVNSPTQFTGGSALYFRAGFSPNTSRAANPSGAAGGAFADGFAAQTRFTTFSPTVDSATISGRVVGEENIPLAGVVIGLSGTQTRTTITDAAGNYHFDDVETGGFYTLTPTLHGYTFSPASRSFSQIGNQTEAGFSGNPSGVPDSNAIDISENFVRQQYLDFLAREPDQNGWLYWTEQINRCGDDENCVREKRREVSAAFFMSDEFQQAGNYVYRVYRGALGRQLSYAEFSADQRQVVGGPNLEQSRAQFADAFVQRPEFLQKYQNAVTAETFVASLLQSMLVDAQVDLSSKREVLIAAYNSAGDLNHSRSAALRAAVEAAEFKTAVYNSSFVLMEYFGYLRRDSDRNGFQFWFNVLNNRDQGNYRGMVCSFITSTEYQRRFGTVVTHSNSECSQ